MNRECMNRECMIRLEGVSFSYANSRDWRGLRNVNMAVNGGDLVIIIGENASGKSTLCRLMAGILKPTHGNIRTCTPPPVLVWQDLELFPLTVRENISIVCRDSKRVDEILSYYHLAPYVRSPISELSGGLKQRVALARAIARDSPAIIFDEPTKSFDPDWVDFFVRWITGPEVAGLTRIVITHDNDLLAQLGSREPQIYILEKGTDGFSRLSNPCKFEDLIKKPPSYYAAKFVGYENIYSVRRERINEVRANIANLNYTDLQPIGEFAQLLVVIPPDCIEIRGAGGAEVRLVSQRPSIGNYIVAKYRWDTGQFTLEFCVHIEGAPPERGYLYFDPNKCILIDRGDSAS
jgi:ABC-type Mn2+/Zn2+ transport system ATPase subunit